MGSTVNSARAALNNRYTPLRQRILDHYSMMALLVGAAPTGKAAKIPPKLGHWDPGSNGHSEHVLAACPELSPIVQRIEELLKQRSKSYIKARHTPLRRGDNFRRKSGKPKVQLNPGEWPPKWRTW